MALAVSYLPDFIHVSFALPFLLIPGAVLLHTLRCAPLWDRLPAGRLAVTAGIWLCALALAAKAVTNVTAAYAAAPARFVPVGRDVGAAIAEGYDAVEDVGQYRIFVRRQPGTPPAPATPE
jgi:hypothetical protein